MTHAVISTTDSPLYSFYLPLVVYCWNKLGIDCIVFKPATYSLRIDSIQHDVKEALGLRYKIKIFQAPEDKRATYAQCSRLFACADGDLPATDQLVTSDIDMCVFDDRFKQNLGDWICVLGDDLVPQSQYPMCYIWGRVDTWRRAFKTEGTTFQILLDQMLGGIECENFRGNYWAKDQEEAYNAFAFGNIPMALISRAIPGTQFAERRADRDSWNPPFGDVIDAHLPRPGYTDENFAKILDFMASKFPNESFGWLIDYRNKFLKCLQ